MTRTTGAARMSTKTEAVDNLQHPTTTFRPILILDSRAAGFQHFNTIRAASIPLAAPRCRVHPITIGNVPQTRQTWQS